jgi:hypothetical protein
MSSRDSGGAFWEAEVDGVIDMGLRDPWPPDFAHYWLSEVDPNRKFALNGFEKPKFMVHNSVLHVQPLCYILDLQQIH